MGLKNPIKCNYEFVSSGLLKSKEQTLYVGTDSKSLEIDSDTNMKKYILEDIDAARPSVFRYFKEQMLLAKYHGKNKYGFRHFGAALHVLEDFFAHSNFVELVLIKIGFTDVFPWVELDENVKKIKNGAEKACKIPLVTGLFGFDDALASVAPKIRDEFFSLTKEEFVALKPGDRTFFDLLTLTLLGDLAAKQDGVPNEDQQKIMGITYLELLNGYNEYLDYRDWWAKQSQNKYYGWIFRATSEIVSYFSFILGFYPKLLFNLLLAIVEPGIKEGQTRSGNLGTDPTHTQVAKDPLTHKLNPLAGWLAVIAVRDVGEEMLKVWEGETEIEKLIEKVENKYFKHPCDSDWADRFVKDWSLIGNNLDRIIKSNDPTALHRHEKQARENIEKYKNELDKIKKTPSKN